MPDPQVLVIQAGDGQINLDFPDTPRGSCAPVDVWDGERWVDTGWQVSGGAQDPVSVASIADGCFDDEVDGALKADLSRAVEEFGSDTWFRICDRERRFCTNGFLVND